MDGGRARVVMFWGALAVAAALVLSFPGVAAAVSRTYTVDADFDEGVLVGVQHDSVHDRLQLSTHPAVLPYIWLPNDGDGTISKIDTITGNEVGRYHVSPHSDSRPSRTTVDLRGNCWIGVRQAGTVVKIGLYEAGQWADRNNDGLCQTSWDRNGNGVIDPDEMLPWGEDECVLAEIVLVPGYEGAYTPGTYAGPYDYEYWGVAPRGMAVDASNNVWAGTWITSKFYYLNGDTGAILKVVDVSSLGHNSYGAVIDRNGVLWSSSLNTHVLRLDPRTSPPTISRVEMEHQIYGLGVDYLGHLFISGTVPKLTRVNVDTGTIDWVKDTAWTCCARGVVCTEDNDVWVASTPSNAVYRFDNDGNLKATITGVGGPAGVAVDAAGKVWIGDLNDENVHRVDPATNTIELTKAVAGAGGHYTYSDMTGIVSWTITSKTGLWTAVYDPGAAGTQWGTISWHADVPAGSDLGVEVRSSEDQTNWSVWEPVANGVPTMATPDGRYLQVRVALGRQFSSLSPVLYDLTVNTSRVPTRAVSCTSFEDNHAPWSALVAGTGETNVWRKALTSTPLAHSGLYAMEEEVRGQGAAGLVLALPTEPTATAEVDLRTWAYFEERSSGDAASFFGLSFASTASDAMQVLDSALGWEVPSATASQFRLLGTVQPTAAGIAVGGWHLVEVQYKTDEGRLGVLLDGHSVGSAVVPAAAGRSPAYVVMCAAGRASGAVQRLLLDDTSVTLLDHPTPALTHAFALLDGQEQVVEGNTVSYVLRYGNAYPVLNPAAVTSTLPDTLYVGVSLPSGYSLVDATPAASREAGGTAVWALPMPALNQAGQIVLRAHLPTGLPEARVDRMWAWATADAGAASADPPTPPGVTTPPDAVWGVPQDSLGQYVDLGPKPDVWVRQYGPRFASPGDLVSYDLQVGNCGTGEATHIVVRDLVPGLLGGGDRIVGNIESLAPAQTWEGAVSGTLPWGIPEATVITSTAYAPALPGETVTDNNQATVNTTIQGAKDPNALTVTPEGGTDRGERLTYTLQCENVGLGTAYGVYATCPLPGALDETTFLMSDPTALRYDPVTRTLVWEVGTLPGGAGATVWFSVKVASTARRARPVSAHATVYFPSVPEVTPTNVTCNVLASTFPDIAWDHWAVLPIEVAFENGIVGGYEDHTYRPLVIVTRDQMATFVARTLAHGDAYVPDGPPTPTFPDVDASFWAYKYVEYCAAQGIVGGYPDLRYHPEIEVDRGQMAGFVARALAGGDGAVPPGPGTATFSDVPVGHWAFKYVEYVVARGIAGGFSDGTYRPDLTVTRDQMAVYVKRAFELPE